VPEDLKTRAPGPTLPETLRLKITYRKVEDLIPYAGNARTHSDKQIDQIAASIRQFGFTNPVLIDGEGGIVAGHGRVAAARKLGLDEVPVIELAHLSEAERRAYRIADNKLTELGEWDEAILRDEIAGLLAEDFDLTLLGISDDDLDALLRDPEALGGDGPVEGEVDLHRFRSGLLRAILAIKETGYGNDTQRRVQAGCGSHCAHQRQRRLPGSRHRAVAYQAIIQSTQLRAAA
jgi:hypothetical protein